MVRFDGDAGGVVVDGETYALRQMHWHSPSEHAVDGRRYDLELHMLHQSETRDGRYAVVAQLYTGSFTTPPCTEGITWTVRRVSRQQVELLCEKSSTMVTLEGKVTRTHRRRLVKFSCL
uniref:Carbonic anhydrase n=1 Tax=Oryza rufipogon TaxID=4529 RepID=A0A0E0Q014_ORYRU